jgi:hypothetical protein
MTQSSQRNSSRTIILFIILVPVIGYLLYFADKKNKESGLRTQECRDECSTKGYPGYDFKWTVLSQPQCQCIGDVVKN